MTTGDRAKYPNNAPGARRWKPVAVFFAALTLLSSVPAYGFLARPIIFAAIGAVTKPPSGWLQFCAENPGECRAPTEAPRDVVLTPDLLQQLFQINSFVNDRVKWTSDLELYGKAEYWAYPLDRGDCEDIALLKRRMLAAAGWPIGALLMTVVDDPSENSERHAVLTVRTDRGEFILDNQTPEILFWYETNYRYLVRQSTANPNVWVAFLNEQPKSGPVPTGQ